jgi:hypothetical protein
MGMSFALFEERISFQGVNVTVPRCCWRSILQAPACCTLPQGVKNESAAAGVSPMVNLGVNFKFPTY